MTLDAIIYHRLEKNSMRVATRASGKSLWGEVVDEKIWKKRMDAFYAWLTQPVHASSLCLFRIVYAYVMMAQIMKWSIMFDQFQATNPIQNSDGRSDVFCRQRCTLCIIRD